MARTLLQSRVHVFLVMFGLLLFVGGCETFSGSSSGASGGTREISTMILKAENGQKVSEEALLEEMLHARVIYLGEKHDNPHHHHLQRALLEKLIARGKRPALAFEFFSRDQTGWLMNFSVGKPSSFTPKGHNKEKEEAFLRERLGWEKRQDWAFYWPLIQLARQHHLPVFGADLPHGTRIRLARGGLEGLSAVERAGLSPTHFRHDDYQRLMQKKLSLSHCGMASEALLERLYVTWVARNDAMAQAIALTLTEFPKEPVVVILGAGHVTHDMGVYERVAFLKPGIRQVNLGFKETQEPTVSPSQYFQSHRVGQTEFAPEHPFLWFTPPVENEENKDPCAQFHRHTLPSKETRAKEG